MPQLRDSAVQIPRNAQGNEQTFYTPSLYIPIADKAYHKINLQANTNNYCFVLFSIQEQITTVQNYENQVEDLNNQIKVRNRMMYS